MPSYHQRRSVRLVGIDYSVPGFYFVTMCTKNREYLFGEIVGGEMVLNECGKIVRDEWLKTSTIRPNIIVDEFVVMPNHFHGIILITDVINDRRGVLTYAPSSNVSQSHIQHPSNRPTTDRGVYQYAPTDERMFQSPSQTVGAIVRGFKSATTTRINQLRSTPANPVWQRNYHEHIIRNDNALNRIRQYIRDNPFNWLTDIDNAQNFSAINGKNKPTVSSPHLVNLIVKTPTAAKPRKKPGRCFWML